MMNKNNYEKTEKSEKSLDSFVSLAESDVALAESKENEWLSIPEVAELLGIRQREVRTMIAKNELIAVRRGENNALAIYSAQLLKKENSLEVLPALKGTLSMLNDIGFSAEEKLLWILEFNAELASTPLEALKQGQIHAVRRAIFTANI